MVKAKQSARPKHHAPRQSSLGAAGPVRKDKVAARLQLVDVDRLERDRVVCRQGQRMVARGRGVDDGL